MKLMPVNAFARVLEMRFMISSKQILKLLLLTTILSLTSFQAVCAAEIDLCANRQRSDALLRRAYEQMLDGQYAAAIKIQKEAVRSDRSNLNARRHLSYSLLHIGASSQAAEHLFVAVQGSEPNSIDMCLVGDSLLQSGEYILAARWFSAAAQLEPTLLCARFGLLKAEAGKLNGQGKLRAAEPSGQISAVILSSPPEIVAVRLVNHVAGNNQSRNAWDSFKGLETISRATR